MMKKNDVLDQALLLPVLRYVSPPSAVSGSKKAIKRLSPYCKAASNSSIGAVDLASYWF
jgi:hypothetical protein